MSSTPSAVEDPHVSLARVTDLVAQLIEHNRNLTAECDALYVHLEELTTQLATAQAANDTLKQEAEAHAAQLTAEADPDHRRLARMRAELDAYLREIDARLAARPTHG